MLRVLRFTGIVCFILGFAGVERSEAQTYNFALSGTGWSIASGLVTFSGNNVTAISGTATGLATQGIANGVFSWSSPHSAGFLTFISTTNYVVDVLQFAPGTSPEIFFGDGPTFIHWCGGSGGSVCNYSFNASGSGVDSSNGTNIVYANCATACALTAASPAPTPGAGLYSWLALILGGVWINRKKIQALAKRAADGFA